MIYSVFPGTMLIATFYMHNNTCLHLLLQQSYSVRLGVHSKYARYDSGA